MATTSALYAATATAITGSWTNAANAQGSTSGTYAAFASSTSGATCALEMSAFGGQAAVGAGATVNSVTYRVRYSIRSNSEASGIASLVASMNAELRAGATVKATNSIRPATWGSDLELEFTVTGLTYADLSDMRVRVTGANAAVGAVTRTYSVDWARLVIDYTAPVTASPGFFAFF